MRTTVFFPSLLFGAFLALLFGAALKASPQTPKQHTIAVQFVYDFHTHHGCPAKSPCVKQFNVYDVTHRGQRTLLFIVPAPRRYHKAVRISARSMPFTFPPGHHVIAVTAQWDTGPESPARACITMVNVRD